MLNNRISGNQGFNYRRSYRKPPTHSSKVMASGKSMVQSIGQSANLNKVSNEIINAMKTQPMDSQALKTSLNSAKENKGIDQSVLNDRIIGEINKGGLPQDEELAKELLLYLDQSSPSKSEELTDAIGKLIPMAGEKINDVVTNNTTKMTDVKREIFNQLPQKKDELEDKIMMLETVHRMFENDSSNLGISSDLKMNDTQTATKAQLSEAIDCGMDKDELKNEIITKFKEDYPKASLNQKAILLARMRGAESAFQDNFSSDIQDTIKADFNTGDVPFSNRSLAHLSHFLDSSGLENLAKVMRSQLSPGKLNDMHRQLANGGDKQVQLGKELTNIRYNNKVRKNPQIDRAHAKLARAETKQDFDSAAHLFISDDPSNIMGSSRKEDHEAKAEVMAKLMVSDPNRFIKLMGIMNERIGDNNNNVEKDLMAAFLNKLGSDQSLSNFNQMLMDGQIDIRHSSLDFKSDYSIPDLGISKFMQDNISKHQDKADAFGVTLADKFGKGVAGAVAGAVVSEPFKLTYGIGEALVSRIFSRSSHESGGLEGERGYGIVQTKSSFVSQIESAAESAANNVISPMALLMGQVLGKTVKAVIVSPITITSMVGKGVLAAGTTVGKGINYATGRSCFKRVPFNSFSNGRDLKNEFNKAIKSMYEKKGDSSESQIKNQQKSVLQFIKGVKSDEQVISIVDQIGSNIFDSDNLSLLDFDQTVPKGQPQAMERIMNASSNTKGGHYLWGNNYQKLASQYIQDMTAVKPGLEAVSTPDQKTGSLVVSDHKKAKFDTIKSLFTSTNENQSDGKSLDLMNSMLSLIYQAPLPFQPLIAVCELPVLIVGGILLAGKAVTDPTMKKFPFLRQSHFKSQIIKQSVKDLKDNPDNFAEFLVHVSNTRLQDGAAFNTLQMALSSSADLDDKTVNETIEKMNQYVTPDNRDSIREMQVNLLVGRTSSAGFDVSLRTGPFKDFMKKDPKAAFDVLQKAEKGGFLNDGDLKTVADIPDFSTKALQALQDDYNQAVKDYHDTSMPFSDFLEKKMGQSSVTNLLPKIMGSSLRKALKPGHYQDMRIKLNKDLDDLNSMIKDAIAVEPPKELKEDFTAPTSIIESVSTGDSGSSQEAGLKIFSSLKDNIKSEMQKYGIIGEHKSDLRFHQRFANIWLENVGQQKDALNTIRKNYLHGSQKKFDQAFKELLETRISSDMPPGVS